MIKNEKEIAYLALDFELSYSVTVDEYSHEEIQQAFIAGFKKCEEIFLERASDGFESALKKALDVDDDDFISWETIEVDIEETCENLYQDAKLSSLKEIEDLKTKLAQVEARNKEYEGIIQSFSREFGDDDFDSMDIAEHHLMLFRNALNQGKGE